MSFIVKKHWNAVSLFRKNNPEYHEPKFINDKQVPACA